MLTLSRFNVLRAALNKTTDTSISLNYIKENMRIVNFYRWGRVTENILGEVKTANVELHQSVLVSIFNFIQSKYKRLELYKSTVIETININVKKDTLGKKGSCCDCGGIKSV